MLAIKEGVVRRVEKMWETEGGWECVKGGKFYTKNERIFKIGISGSYNFETKLCVKRRT